MEQILEFFSNAFTNLSWLAVLIVSMLPIAEAKVAIPFGISQEIWGNGALSPMAAASIALIGSLIPSFFIIPFLKPIFNKLKNTKLFHKVIVVLEHSFKKKAEKQEHKIKVRISSFRSKKVNTFAVNLEKPAMVSIQTNGQPLIEQEEKIEKQNLKLTHVITLLFFVALPLPFAGVWTSSAIAAFGNMKTLPSFTAIAIGNLIEVIMITLVCVLFIDSVVVLLIGTIVLVLAYGIFLFVSSKRRKKFNLT